MHGTILVKLKAKYHKDNTKCVMKEETWVLGKKTPSWHHHRNDPLEWIVQVQDAHKILQA